MITYVDRLADTCTCDLCGRVVHYWINSCEHIDRRLSDEQPHCHVCDAPYRLAAVGAAYWHEALDYYNWVQSSPYHICPACVESAVYAGLEANDKK